MAQIQLLLYIDDLFQEYQYTCFKINFLDWREGSKVSSTISTN